MIAVTGANGLLGSFVVRKLVENNLPVAAIVRKSSTRDSLAGYGDKISWREADVLNVPDLADALEGVESVIHTAATVSFNPRSAMKIFEVNVEGTRNVVNVCLKKNIRKVIHVSSVAALGRQRAMISVDEENKWVDSSVNSNYAKSKYLAELEMFRGMEEGLEVSMVNPSAILAPADWTKSSSQLFKYVWKEKMFYTDGLINYVDARDVADMIYTLYKGNYQGQKFIASAGWAPLKVFLDEIARRFGKKAPSMKIKGSWTEVIGRMEEVRSLLAGREPLLSRESARLAKESFQYSNQKAKDTLGFKFREMKETLDWCCEEYLRKINTNK